MSPLQIYKASAGSGKTFALTMEYLKLLFTHPGNHRNILAVTFTNKAAGEMKQRILNNLHGLSVYNGKDNRKEMRRLTELTGLDERTISQLAAKQLSAILNDYSRFSVGTIDKFFQVVIRAFTHEIGIQPGYNLELDHQKVLVHAVDQLFQELTQQPELQKWLIRFAEERLGESRSYNFKQEIIQLGMQLFKESFQGLFPGQDLSVLEKENMDRYAKELVQIEGDSLARCKDIGTGALEHMAQAGVTVEQFRGKSKSPPMLFQAAAAGEELNFTPTRLKALEEIDPWLNKGASREMVHLTGQVLMPLLNGLYEEQKIRNTASAIRRNFYHLGILGDIWEQVRRYTQDHNLFLIADSSRFLRGIIGGNQVPFIYERTGNRYQHIMLDEFQDTSVFQYDNFRPLLDNALASGDDNMVVGDVKQSIYRWRNSDWKILASDLEQDFGHQECTVESLKQNFRSREQIIRFNNTIFQLVPQRLATIIRDELVRASVNRDEAEQAVKSFEVAYDDAVQDIPENMTGTGGFVHMEIFSEDTPAAFRERVLSCLPGWIEEIGRSGIEPGETAILVRTRKEGIAVANILLEYAAGKGNPNDFRLISNESLLLVQNSAVSLLVSLLRYLLYPEDALNNALLKYYLRQPAGKFHTDHLFDSSLPVEKLFPSSFADMMQHYKQLPLYELAESLIRMFRLGESTRDLPYIQAFQDLIIDLHRKEPVGLPEFLYYWEQHGAKKGITFSEESNAIRILTIHKAKGLEFKAVVVPFCDWEITTDQRKSNIIWCDTSGTPMDRVPTVPVRFSSKMVHTLFSAAYYRERTKGYMDNLNLLYVALTRARDVLYLGVPGRKDEQLKHTGDLLISVLGQKPGKGPATPSLASCREGDIIRLGTMPVQKQKAGEREEWRFSSYPVHHGNRRLKVRTGSDEYFLDEEGIFRTDRMYGNLMHLVFSRIVTEADVEPVLGTMQKEGLLPGDEAVRLRQLITEMISRPRVADWFSHKPERTIYNERNIYCGDGTILRPDRVIVENGAAIVVDFKFGKSERSSHTVQVKSYIKHLKMMDYNRVTGYLWYMNLDRIVKIETE